MGKAQLVFIPSPAMGHLVSTVEIAKLLVSRDDRLCITVLVMKFPFDSKGGSGSGSGSSSYRQSLFADAPECIRFVDLPPPQDDSMAELLSKSPGSFLSQFIDSFKPRVRDIISEMIVIAGSEPESAQLAGFVVDMFCTTMIDVANEFGVPTYVFFTSAAGFLGLVFHLRTLQDDHNQDITELKDSDAKLSVPAFANPVPAKVLPSSTLDKEGRSTMFLTIARRLRETEGIVVNTFTDLESHAVKSLSEDDKIPPVYPVGPVLNLKGGANEVGNHQSDAIMSWLDNQPPSSVVFLCFGSMGSFSGDQVTEIAHALERSGHRFLWSLRRPPPKGKVGLPCDYENPNEVLPEGFSERTEEIGKVIGWAPQVAVLSHPAVGGFVSHCGWNSTLESLWCGVPVATWPVYAEQQLNAFEMVRELGLAVEIKLDYKKDFWMESEVIVTAEEIEGGIRRLMDREGAEIREKVKEMSEKSRVAVKKGGSSFASVGRLIEDLLRDK